MLLSVAASILLSKRFDHKASIFLLAVTIALISLFSAGLPYRESSTSSYWPLHYTSGVVIRYPLPLSFPFYAFINHTVSPSYPSPYQISFEIYQIRFLTLQLPQSVMRTFIYQNATWTPQNLIMFYADWGDYFLYYTFFLSLNLVGTIIGYWIAKPPITAKLLRGSKALADRLNSVINWTLDRVSLSILITCFLLLTGIDLAQTVSVFPQYEVGLLARVFIVFFADWAWLYFPFRIILTLILIFIILHYTTRQLSKKLFALLSLINLAFVISNTYFSIIMWLST